MRCSDPPRVGLLVCECDGVQPAPDSVRVSNWRALEQPRVCTFADNAGVSFVVLRVISVMELIFARMLRNGCTCEERSVVLYINGLPMLRRASPYLSPCDTSPLPGAVV